jgi:hypothetical protein
VGARAPDAERGCRAGRLPGVREPEGQGALITSALPWHDHVTTHEIVTPSLMTVLVKVRHTCGRAKATAPRTVGRPSTVTAGGTIGGAFQVFLAPCSLIWRIPIGAEHGGVQFQRGPIAGGGPCHACNHRNSHKRHTCGGSGKGPAFTRPGRGPAALAFAPPAATVFPYHAVRGSNRSGAFARRRPPAWLGLRGGARGAAAGPELEARAAAEGGLHRWLPRLRPPEGPQEAHLRPRQGEPWRPSLAWRSPQWGRC